MKKFPVDVVYTWVDGSDSKWLEKKNRALAKSENRYRAKGVSGVGRFRSNDELKYSLRSVGEFAPWIRKVFIVTDDQVPDWLDTSNPRVEIVDHKGIFEDRHLPCFSSRAINLRLHHIEGLSERFLSFDDDFFLGRPTSVSDFFHESGKGKLFTGRKLSWMWPRRLLRESSMPSKGRHHYAVFNSRRLIYDRYGRVVNYDRRHVVKVASRATRYKLESEFPGAVESTLSRPFRHTTDVQVWSLEAYFEIATRKNRPCYMGMYRGDRREYALRFIRRKRDYVHIPLPRVSVERIKSRLSVIRKYGPLMFCINDGPSVPRERIEVAADFLKEYFPERSEYEL
jgi:hypothetical protein